MKPVNEAIEVRNKRLNEKGTVCQNLKVENTNQFVKRVEPANDSPVQFGSQNLQKMKENQW